MNTVSRQVQGDHLAGKVRTAKCSGKKGKSREIWCSLESGHRAIKNVITASIKRIGI